MLYLAQSPGWFRSLGTFAFLLQLSIYVFGLPPFHYGLWYYSEPIMLALMLSCVPVCGWFWLGIAKSWLVFRRPVNPLWLVWVGWVAWQWLVTPLVDSAWRNWFGHPEYGEGAAWYTATLLSTMLAFALWQEARFRRLALSVAAAHLLILSALHFCFDESQRWSPNRWGDYLAFMIGWGWIALLAAYPTLRLRRYALFALANFLLLFAVGSTTAFLLFSYAWFVVGIPLWCAQAGIPHFQNAGRTWRALAMLACFAPVVWVGYSLVHTHDAERNSFVERQRLNQMAVAAIKDEPSRLLFGKGWASFIDDTMKYAMVDGTWRFKDGKSEANTNFTSGGSFHPHSQPLAALLFLGIPGMILWFAMPLTVIARVPKVMFWHVVPWVVGLFLLGYFWFPIAQVMGFQALALAAMMTLIQPPESAQKTSAIPPAACLAALVLAFVFLWSGWQQYRAMRYGSDIIAFTTPPYRTKPGEWIAEDIARGGDRLRVAANLMMERIVLHDQRPTAPLAKNYAYLLEAANKMAQTPHIGAYSGSLELALQTVLMANIQSIPFAPLQHQSDTMLAESVLRVAAMAPKREDLSALYLYRLEKEDDRLILKPLLERLLAQNPDHRAALWVSGKLLRQDPAQAEEGVRRMKRALALGAEAVYPITNQEKEALP